MEIIEILKSKKVKVTEIPKWGSFLRKLWEDNFSNHISLKEKKDINLYDDGGACGYLWHFLAMRKESV